MTNTSSNQKRYQAFISYRHADNKQLGRQWATWLHQAIETYEVPYELVGTKNELGEVIPERIFPIFRDEDELPAHADLGNSITKALDQSKLLIVLCSPQAVESTYVADEIDYFKSLGHSDRIIAALIEGEPNTSWDKAKEAHGFSKKDECFPLPLQFEYDQDGKPTNKRAEPIAADFRINNEGTPEQGWTSTEAYRLHLRKSSNLDNKTIGKKIDSYQKQQQLMLLKIIAGVLGVPLGELTQRDKEYQLEIEKQKAKKLRIWLSAVAILAIFAMGTGVFAWLQREAAIENELIAVKRLQERMIADSERLTGEAIELLDQKDAKSALRKLFEALPTNINQPEWPINPKTKIALNRAVAMHGNDASFKGPSDAVEQLQYIDNDRILIITKSQTVYIYSTFGQLIHEWNITEPLEYAISEDSNQLVTAAYVSREIEDVNGYNGKSYADFFVAKTYDLDTGNLLFDIDQRMDDTGHESISNYDGSLVHFSKDAGHYLSKKSYWGDSEKHQLVVTDTKTGKILNTIETDLWVSSATLLSDGGIIAELVKHADTESTHKQALIYVAPLQSEVRTLLDVDRQPVCREGRLMTSNDGDTDISGSLEYRASHDNRHVIAKIKDADNSYSGWCLLSWELASNDDYQLVHFEQGESDSLTSNELELLSKAYRTSPVLVERNINGKIEAIKNSKSVHIYNSNNFHYSATADDDRLQVSHFIDEQLISDGGFINAISIDVAKETIWYASVDGLIRSKKLFSNTRFQYSNLDDADELHVFDGSIVAVDQMTIEETGSRKLKYVMMDKQDNAFKSPQTLNLSAEKWAQTVSFEPFYFGILSDAENQHQLIDLVPLIGKHSSAPPGTLKRETRYGYDAPPSSKTHIAYLINDEIVLYSMADGKQRKVLLEDNYSLFDMAFSGEDLIMSVADKKYNELPDERVIHLVKVSMDVNAKPEYFYQKKAQGLEIESMSHQQHLMLTWDIRYDKDKEIEVLTSNGTISPITTAWDESFGLNYLIPESGQRIIVIEPSKTIRSFDYNGNLLSQVLTNQDWYSARFREAKEDYIISDDSFSFVTDDPSCSFNFDDFSSGTYIDDSSAHFLVVMNYDETKIFDIDTCTALYDVPFAVYKDDLAHIDENGVFRIAYRSWLATINTSVDFESNYKAGLKILSQ